MKFEMICRYNKNGFPSYVTNKENFYTFTNDFSIEGVVWSQPTNISAAYLLRLLTDGSSQRARGHKKGYLSESDECSSELYDYNVTLFDHCALWKDVYGGVICTAMPYGDREDVLVTFNRLKKEYDYPESIKLKFLDDKYRYRTNGDFMIMMYYDNREKSLTSKSFESIKDKAIKYSRETATVCQTKLNSYIRNPYVKEYTKKRAGGICDLCGEKAPFIDSNGEPFLEVHHIVRLADGGEDSIYNTVALCPNCHRKMHCLDLYDDVEKLKLKVKRYDDKTDI